MRVSQYEFFIHFEKEKKTLLLNGLYGTIDIVPATIGKELEIKHNSNAVFSKTEYTEVIENRLLQRKHLTCYSREEEIQLCVSIANKFEKAQKSNDEAKKYVILLTYDCNFSCPYCYEHCGNSALDRKTKYPVISKEQIDDLFTIMNSYPYREERAQIELFGGEPLFDRTLPAVRYIAEKARQVNRTIAVTTNGYCLDLFEDLLGPDAISDLIITVDGPKTIHDKRRVSKEGKSTFDKIVNNIKIALDKGVYVRVRANIDKTNIYEYPHLVQFFDDNGYYAYPNFSLAYGLIKNFPGIINKNVLYDYEALDILQSTITDIDLLKKATFEIGGNTLDHFMNSKETAASRTRYCGAVGASFFFAPDGNIFTCNEAVGNDEYAIGYYDSEGMHIDEGKEKMWRKRRLQNLPECILCPLALICSGGCAFRAIASGKPDEPYCDEAKTILASRLKSQIRLANLIH